MIPLSVSEFTISVSLFNVSQLITSVIVPSLYITNSGAFWYTGSTWLVPFIFIYITSFSRLCFFTTLIKFFSNVSEVFSLLLET